MPRLVSHMDVWQLMQNCLPSQWCVVILYIQNFPIWFYHFYYYIKVKEGSVRALLNSWTLQFVFPPKWRLEVPGLSDNPALQASLLLPAVLPGHMQHREQTGAIGCLCVVCASIQNCFNWLTKNNKFLPRRTQLFSCFLLKETMHKVYAIILSWKLLNPLFIF